MSDTNVTTAEPAKPTGLDLMREPFPAHQIGKLPKPFKKESPKGECKECGGYHGLPAMHLDYVGHAALTLRLLDCDPHWYWEPLALDDGGLPRLDENGGLWIRLHVCGMSRLGYGTADAKADRVKELIGDALRNAAMRFGAALGLWHKGELEIDEEPRALSEAEIAGLKKKLDGATDRETLRVLRAEVLAVCANAGPDKNAHQILNDYSGEVAKKKKFTTPTEEASP